ncbi:hypothetical protein BKA81DRAFT_356157 [Phyllosticta paracitricarpa]
MEMETCFSFAARCQQIHVWRSHVVHSQSSPTIVPLFCFSHRQGSRLFSTLVSYFIR